MNDGEDRCLVFLIADIPTNTIDLLFQCTEEYLSEFDSPDDTPDAYNEILIVDSKDISSITKGRPPNITSSPTVFHGHTIQEVKDWFDANITQPRPEGFMTHCFLVLDDKSTKDDSCVFVCTQDSAPGEIHSLRCGFDVAIQNVIACEIQGQSIEEGLMGSFMRSGVTMTRETWELAESGGMYIEDGEVMVDQAWRDFSNW